LAFGNEPQHVLQRLPDLALALERWSDRTEHIVTTHV
jgi:hypothetical protein